MGLVSRPPSYASKPYTRPGYSQVLIIRTREAIRQIAPESTYWDAVKEAEYNKPVRDAAYALMADLKAGYYNGAHDMAHAEVFDDLLDRAEYLLDHGDVVPAAVLAGSVGESHLRQLAQKHGVPTVGVNGKPLNGGQLSQNLAKASAYDAVTAKHVTAWQGIRNDAAHGNGAQVDATQVRGMIAGLRSFIANHPA